MNFDRERGWRHDEVSKYPERWPGLSPTARETLEMLIAAGEPLSPGEIAAESGKTRTAIGEHLARLWARYEASPTDTDSPAARTRTRGPRGRYTTHRWQAPAVVPWRPSDKHLKILKALPPMNGRAIGTEAVAAATSLKVRRCKVLVNDLWAAGLVECYSSVYRDDRRRQIALWLCTWQAHQLLKGPDNSRRTR